MNTKFKIALAVVAGAALGAAAMQGLHAQAKPKAYTVSELEVIDATGVSLIEWQGATMAPALGPEGVLKLVIAPEREPLYAHIDARFAKNKAGSIVVFPARLPTTLM